MYFTCKLSSAARENISTSESVFGIAVVEPIFLSIIVDLYPVIDTSKRYDPFCSVLSTG